ncbi:DUF6252 family protein [Emticicia agri]|uniref:Lipoprotein n=1 Tax=Emticicia agri TaxID=2492393 RepID=A0A4Q5LU96_9BACT|nr:DUF6252 family protein [Emticicia agri]RYU93095.1 hypothetical protein EWM59_23705 [Emticicia agri]
MKLLLIFFALTISLSGCSFFDSLLPRGKFFCKIDGENFKPRKDDAPVGGIGASPIRRYLNLKDTLFTIYVDGENQSIGLTLKARSLDKINVGKYLLKNNNKNSHAIFNPDRRAHKQEIIYSKNGYINVTKSEGFKISGTFEFTTEINNRAWKEYKITKGQFNEL